MTDHRDPLTHRLPYDPDRPCAKCGCLNITTKHTRFVFVPDEALRRTCTRCAYQWDEDPVDLEPVETRSALLIAQWAQRHPANPHG